jgi:tetratricopeptide (TPR) repeat protein
MVFLAICVFPFTAAFSSEDLTSVQVAFLKGEYTRVVDETRQLLSNKTPVSSEDEILYLQGVSALKLKDLELARSALKRLLTDHPRSRWVPQAWMAFGETFAAAGEDEKALAVYQELLQSERAPSVVAEASLRLGQIQRRLGLWEESKESLGFVVAQAPNSFMAAQAQDLLQGGEFFFSVQVGAFETKANASRLKDELQRRGYDTEVSEVMMRGKRFHRVRVGRFSRHEEAEWKAERLRTEGFPAQVVP